MAKKQRADNDSIGMMIARGLSTLAIRHRFNLAEAGDVQQAFAALVRAVELVNDLERRVESLERDKAVPPKLKAVAS